MSTHAVLHGDHAAEAEPGGSRLRINRLGLWLFIISDAALFGLLATARFYIAGTEVDDHLNQNLGLIITAILLLSSMAAFRAETAFAHGNVARGRRWILITILMGLVFFVGVVYEWSIAEFSADEEFGTAFYSMTGMHAFHVFTGVLFLGFAWLHAGQGRYTRENHWGATAIVMYWHFVDVVWVFFYPILYLLQ